MLAMASSKDSIHLSYQAALLAVKSHPIHDPENKDVIVCLQTCSPPRFLRRRRNPALAMEPFDSDDFRMYEYKVRRCMRGRSHDWTNCPFAHPGEKARRRDPRKVHYSGSPCPDFRKGSCPRGDACEYAHGVFECWLHPARYRTQVCKDGKGCTRRVCFFAHSTQQLRQVAVYEEGSLKESVSMANSHVHELDSYTHDLGSPSSLQTNSSEECLTEVVWPSNTPCVLGSTVNLSPEDVYSNVSSISDMLSMLTLSSQDVLSSPPEAVPTMGFPSINSMGDMVHLPSSNLPSAALGPSDVSSEMGATSQNSSFTYEWPSPPAFFSAVQLYIPPVEGLCTSKCDTTSELSSYVGASPLQQTAAWQNFLMHEGYCGGGSNISATSEEFLDTVYYGGGCGDVAMQQGYYEVANELNGASKSTSLTNRLALLRKEVYELSSYNMDGRSGLPSPTSTLAGPMYSPPFSSPPLSPLSPSCNEVSNGCSSRGHGNGGVVDTSLKTNAHIQNKHCPKELEFTHKFTDQRYTHSSHHSRLSPCVSQCSFEAKKWSPHDSLDGEDAYICDILQLKFDVQHKSYGGLGGEIHAENGMPDLGWVHELVM